MTGASMGLIFRTGGEAIIGGGRAGGSGGGEGDGCDLAATA